MAIRFKINDVEVTAEQGESLLTVARRHGFEIPALCYHEAVRSIGACRICLVEVKTPERTLLSTSCNFGVEEGIEVTTDSPLIHQHRRINLELTLARAPGSAAIRALAAEYDVIRPRFPARQDSALQDCILCELCVRTCEQLGHHALAAVGRGDRKRIGPPFGKPADPCVGCGSCLSVCPTRCILLKDTRTTRTIWGRIFEFHLCKVCRAPVITKEHRAFAIAQKGLPEDYYDVCESCKQAATSKRFAAVAW